MKKIKLNEEQSKLLYNYVSGRLEDEWVKNERKEWIKKYLLPTLKDGFIIVNENGDSDYWKNLYGYLGVHDNDGMAKSKVCTIRQEIRRERGIPIDEKAKKKICNRIEDKLKKGGESFISPTIEYDTVDILEVIKENPKIKVRKTTPTGKVKIQRVMK